MAKKVLKKVKLDKGEATTVKTFGGGFKKCVDGDIVEVEAGYKHSCLVNLSAKDKGFQKEVYVVDEGGDDTAKSKE